MTSHLITLRASGSEAADTEELGLSFGSVHGGQADGSPLSSSEASVAAAGEGGGGGGGGGAAFPFPRDFHHLNKGIARATKAGQFRRTCRKQGKRK
jgi:hypothetical protein